MVDGGRPRVILVLPAAAGIARGACARRSPPQTSSTAPATRLVLSSARASRRSAAAPRDATGSRQHRLLREISALVSTELHERARAYLRMCASFTTHAAQ